MNLRPCLDEAPLGRRHASAQTLQGVDREDGGVVLVVRMKMWAVMGATDLDEHPNDDSEKPRQFRHDDTLHRPS